jgi:hypothetical protein
MITFRAMSKLQTNIRVRAEGSGIILKPIVIILVLLYDTYIQNGDGHLALVAFALGQLAYAATLFCVYRFHYGAISFMPKPIRSSSHRHLRFVCYKLSDQRFLYIINNPFMLQRLF